MGACVVKTKKNLNSMMTTFITAGTIIINARNFAGLRFTRKKRCPSDQYFETDKLLYEEVLQEQPLGLLSPDQINTLLQTEEESEATRVPSQRDSVSIRSQPHQIVKIPLEIQSRGGLKGKQIEVEEEQKMKEEEEVMKEQLLNMESDEQEKEEVRRNEEEGGGDNVVLVEGA